MVNDPLWSFKLVSPKGKKLITMDITWHRIVGGELTPNIFELIGKSNAKMLIPRIELLISAKPKLQQLLLAFGELVIHAEWTSNNKTSKKLPVHFCRGLKGNNFRQANKKLRTLLQETIFINIQSYKSNKDLVANTAET